MKNAKILWIDLEMTGLEPKKDRILEVAAIATDWDFNEIATFESAVKVENEILESRMVGDFWDTFSETRDALKLQNSRATKNSQEVEADLIKFIEENFAEEISKGEKILLGGNSIHQDRRFIRAEWKKLEKMLHYRMLDVSAWKVVMSAKFKRVFAKPENHRALDDIRGSIEELKFYLKKGEKVMDQSEIKDFLLNFDAAEVRKDEENELEIFEVNFDKLEKIWQEKMAGDLGDFERETGEKILSKITEGEEPKAIFAIIHDGSKPLKVEMKTGAQLARILREKESVVPSKFMSEREWNLIIGQGQVSAEELRDLFRLSYRLVCE